ncbi:hypothetical protein WG66_009001 [Moniliophthora roreri]|nr:hypothetical protein WG66_009001 [Moniliophthora roreri]
MALDGGNCLVVCWRQGFVELPSVQIGRFAQKYLKPPGPKTAFYILLTQDLASHFPCALSTFRFKRLRIMVTLPLISSGETPLFSLKRKPTTHLHFHHFHHATQRDPEPPVKSSAIERIRKVVETYSFTNGTCKVPVEFCDLYYKMEAVSPASSALSSPGGHGKKRQKMDPLNTTRAPTEYLELANASADQLAKLISACEAAPFGHGPESVLDESYRKALKMELSQFAMPPDLASTDIFHKVQKELVDTNKAMKRHNKGAFFKLHKDPPRAENMFGSLVIIFPTAHKGGQLILSENGSVWTFDAPEALIESTPSTPEVALVVFYSNVTHKVKPVTKGARVTLTYNLYFEVW